MFLLTSAGRMIRYADKAQNIAEERPDILPWFLGFAVALFLLNVIISKVTSRRSMDRENNKAPKK